MIHTRREVGIKKTNSLVKAEKSHKVNRYISNNLGGEPREMDKWKAWKEFHKKEQATRINPLEESNSEETTVSLVTLARGTPGKWQD